MEKLKETLLKNYSIEVVHMERIEYGLWEENFKVETATNKYFVKRFWKKDRLEKRYDSMVSGILLGQKLREKRIPAPLHIYDDENNIFSRNQGETYQVNEWVEGITYRPGKIPAEAAYSMGELLGKLHKIMNPDHTVEEVDALDAAEAIKFKKKILLELLNRSCNEDREIIKSVQSQIKILEMYIGQTAGSETIISRRGIVYNSYWIEQLLFNEDHSVAALLDWTDGAGGEGYLMDDIDTAFFASAFDEDGIVNFAKGYQSVYELSRKEWESVVEYSCTRHLDNEWIYNSWITPRSNRVEHWKRTALKWCEGTEYRFINKEKILKMILEGLFV